MKPPPITLTRAQMAAAIIKEPHFYMVCEGCHAICDLKLITQCPVCHCYKFDTDTERICSIARSFKPEPDSLPYEL